MTTWAEFKNNIKSVPEDELTVIETLAYLQAERIRRGIKQRDFADQIGMKQPQLAKIEKMDSTPSLDTLNRYAAGLGLEVKLSIVPLEGSLA